MPWASSEVINVLAFLLPGFVAAAIYYSLTSHPKPSAFERLIQALIFTAVIQASVSLLPDSLPSPEIDIGADAPWDPAWPVAIAVILALIVVVVVNYDLAHSLLRWLRITRENAYSSEWDSSLARNDGSYVVVHLAGERRLYGWPDEWPNDPKRGHFRITQAEWLTDEGPRPLENVSGVLIPVGEVEMVEFVGTGDSEE
ncbi:MAG: hypothetical protein F4Y97_06625 [Dehalococcoidia bacterium]|nr:hypothetical protein [Dehalococcoidia bacterium]